jgi:hypothetical protein
MIIYSNNNLNICLHTFCPTRTAEHPSQASLLDPLVLLSPAFPTRANMSSTPTAAMSGNFPVPFNLQRPRSNTTPSVSASLGQPFNLQRPRSNTTSSVSSSLGQQVQSRVDSGIQQNTILSNSGENRLLELLYLERERAKHLQQEMLQELCRPNEVSVLQEEMLQKLRQH